MTPQDQERIRQEVREKFEYAKLRPGNRIVLKQRVPNSFHNTPSRFTTIVGVLVMAASIWLLLR